jgi:clan AA aspartic protease
MTGQFLPGREFVVDLRLSNEDGEQLEVSAVVDTGFSGYLTLPLSIVEKLGLLQTDFEEASLADGSVLRFGVYTVIVEWDEEERAVPALATEGSTLLRISMLLGSVGTFEFQEGGSVTFESVG